MRAKVLVVEDSPAQLDWLVGVLARQDYDVFTAVDGRDAIRKVRTNPPDLVLLDMILPDMDGLEVLRIIKARPQEAFVPVILLSVKSDLDSRVAALRIGADDFLAKPFADAEVLARAAAMLRIKALQDQLHQTKAKLERLSVTDGLTGLYNYRYFQEQLRKEFMRAQRYAEPMSLIMIDLDHFKRVNDRYGHPFGDRVLVEAAELIRSSIREPDICARYGGEEFSVILPKTDVQGTLCVAERIKREMETKVYRASETAELDSVPSPALPDDPLNVIVTSSLGLAFHPSKDIASAEQLVKYADEALYRAKSAGRNRICLYEAQAYRFAAGAHR